MQPAPEMVVLFLPGDHFLSAALERDPELLERALAQKVLLATPVTLISVLKGVAYGWRQERLAKNAVELRRIASEFYDRVCACSPKPTSNPGAQLAKAVESYNRSAGILGVAAGAVAQADARVGRGKPTEAPPPAAIEPPPGSRASQRIMPADMMLRHFFLFLSEQKGTAKVDGDVAGFQKSSPAGSWPAKRSTTRSPWSNRAAAREDLTRRLIIWVKTSPRSKKPPRRATPIWTRWRACANLPATVSIKLTQFGLDLSEKPVSKMSAPCRPSQTASRAASRSTWNRVHTPIAR